MVKRKRRDSARGGASVRAFCAVMHLLYDISPFFCSHCCLYEVFVFLLLSHGGTDATLGCEGIGIAVVRKSAGRAFLES